MAIHLKPCPFCGGEGEFERYGNSRQSCIVACTNCGCRLETNESEWNSGSDWNRREDRRAGERGGGKGSPGPSQSTSENLHHDTTEGNR